MRSIKRRCPGVHNLFSQEANPHPQISKDATEKRVARNAADFRSGMSGYEWHAKHSAQGFRVNQRELLQISNPSQQSQQGSPL